MIETKPWPENSPELQNAPPDAVTVEFTQEEALAALAAYAGNVRGDNFPATAFVQYRSEPGKTTIRLTYWRRNDEESQQ